MAMRPLLDAVLVVAAALAAYSILIP